MWYGEMKKEDLKTKIIEALNTDFHYNCEYDYSNSRDCEDHGCNEEGICRCGRIEDFEIKSVELNNIANCIGDNLAENDEFTRYCIDRIFHALKLWDISKWDYSIEHGYYGQEIEWVKIGNDTRSLLYDAILEVMTAKTNKEKLFSVLKLEYGYVLDTLAQFDNWEIIKVPVKQIRAGAIKHYVKLDAEIVKTYDKYELPIGICIKGLKTPKYRLMDGYHRYASAVNRKVEEVKVIVNT